MDFIIVYSNYSRSCVELFALYPNLQTRGICADNKTMRELLKTRLHILAVPTLLVVTSTDIIHRVVGFDDIKNWLWVTSAQIDSARADPISDPMDPQNDISIDSREPQQSPGLNHTPIDGGIDVSSGPIPDISFEDDLLPPMQEVSHAVKSSTSVKSTADELQRERETYFETIKSAKR